MVETNVYGTGTTGVGSLPATLPTGDRRAFLPRPRRSGFSTVLAFAGKAVEPQPRPILDVTPARTT